MSAVRPTPRRRTKWYSVIIAISACTRLVTALQQFHQVSGACLLRKLECVLTCSFLLGQWLCRTCSMGIKPDCVLCPNKGGAMKSNKSGKHWAHVSCALWIPEVSIGCVDRMEPITKISSIPQSRWSLICVLCRKRVGSCIQCSVKPCKTAYHVTCAFQHGLEMRAIIEEGNAEDGVKLRSYCQKHSMSKGKKENSGAHGGGSASVASAMHKANRFASGAGGAADDGNSACGNIWRGPTPAEKSQKN